MAGREEAQKSMRKAFNYTDDEEKKDDAGTNSGQAAQMLSDAGSGLSDLAGSAAEMLGYGDKKKKK